MSILSGVLLREFRCFEDNALLGKQSIESSAEVKCQKCNTFNWFIQGTSYFKDGSGNVLKYTKTKKRN
jgi:phage FluMu protein Com